jgi:predicted nuclease of predicted toxin-antitoxin system
MKLLFDHNLSYKLVLALQSVFPGSQHVRDVGMSAADDDAIWKYAQENGFMIVSKDSDFYYRSMLLGHPPKAVWIRLGNCATKAVSDLLRMRQKDLEVFEQDSSASFLILP